MLIVISFAFSSQVYDHFFIDKKIVLQYRLKSSNFVRSLHEWAIIFHIKVDYESNALL